MGMSALKFVLNKAKVNPVLPVRGDMRQPAYVRSGTTLATSDRLLKYRSCIQTELSNKHPGSRGAVRQAFANAAHTCRGK